MNEFLMRVALLSLSFEKEISIYAKESSAYKIKCIWRLLVCAWKGRAGAAMAGGITRAASSWPRHNTNMQASDPTHPKDMMTHTYRFTVYARRPEGDLKGTY